MEREKLKCLPAPHLLSQMQQSDSDLISLLSAWMAVFLSLSLLQPVIQESFWVKCVCLCVCVFVAWKAAH